MPVSFLAIGATLEEAGSLETAGAWEDSAAGAPQEASNIALTAKTNKRGFMLGFLLFL
jgi:hypothetical protein